MEEATVAQQAPKAKNDFAVLALRELSKVDRGLEKLAQTYGNVVYDVSTTKGMEQAKKARLAIREVRYRVENIRKDEASRIKAAQTALNAEAERIKSAILLIEDPINAQIDAEEERKRIEKEEAARKEQERVFAIRSEIERLAGTPARVADLSIPEIHTIVAAVSSAQLDPDFYKEFLAEAEHTRTKVVGELHTLIAKIQLREEEAARLSAQQAEIEALRRELAQAKALLASKTQDVEAPQQPAAVIEPSFGPSTQPVSLASDFAGVAESLYQGEPIDPETESWASVEASSPLPIDIADVHEDRLFEDGFPGVDRVVFAVASHFGVTEEAARGYITRTAEEILF